MALRKKNPNTAAWLFGAAVASGVLYWAFKKTVGKQRNYVGSGWSWPNKDVFPTTRSFGDALNTLGYGAAVGLPDCTATVKVGCWEILGAETMETVKEFQRDFNTVRRASKKEGFTIGKKLEVDGLIGANTISAFITALKINEEDSWIAWVTDARAEVGQEFV